MELANKRIPGFGVYSLQSGISKAYGRGEDPLQAMPELREILTGIIRQVEERRL